MLANRDIIIFSDDWGRLPSTLQHIAKELLKENRIFWIGSLGLRKPNLNLKDFKRAVNKLVNVFSKKESANSPEQKSPNQLHPFVIPFHNYKVIRYFNKRSLKKKLFREIGIHKIINPILLTSSPLVSDIVGEIGESSAHYFCLDDYSKLEGTFKELVDFERELLEKVDTSFSVSDILVNTRKPSNGKSYFLPQGVQCEHFQKRIDQIPAEIADIPKPVVGFFGLISEWINLEAIEKCVKTYPQYSFILIGKSLRNLDSLKQFKNFFYLDEIKYSILPNYASIFDVGLIPFDVNELTVAANPLKLLEYLSMGIPVLSSDLPEVRKFNDFVFVAKDDYEFVELIKRAIEDNLPERNRKRIEKAREYSWASIAERISGIIQRTELEKKNNSQ
ncbi:MAG: glycosyltransferase [Bacteroidetes bacterium]|nr:glycosyltransferase [Bacteroidota bacterium]